MFVDRGAIGFLPMEHRLTPVNRTTPRHVVVNQRYGRKILAGLALGVALVFSTAPMAHAWEQIDSFDAEATVLSNGDLDVTETIVWNFTGTSDKHGIFRFVPRVHLWTLDRKPEWAGWEQFDRVTDVSFLEVSSPTGANVDRHTERKGVNEVLRLGNKKVNVTGVQTYKLHWTLKRAVVRNELRYDITGSGWTVNAAAITARVKAPVEADRQPRCEVGGLPDPSCTLRVDGDTITVSAKTLGTEVVIPLDPARVASPDVVFEPHQTLRRGFDWTNGQPFMAAVLGAVAIGGLTLLGRRGRDRLYGSGAAFAGPGAPERKRGLTERLASPVEFAPPEGVAPGMIGSIRNGAVDPVGLSATLVDLAVRGHLQIEAIDDDGKGRKPDDHALSIPPADRPRKDELRGYEQTLIATLFGGETRVTLSELKKAKTLYKGLATVRESIQNDVVAAGYWVGRPDRVKAKWMGLGIVVAVVGVVTTVVLASSGDKGLLGIPIIAFGLGILALAPTMPVRTAAGSRVRARLNGFEQLFDAGEGERIAHTEKLEVFSQYLPYAMAFGNVKQWVKRFASLGQLPDTGWYTTPYGTGFDPGRFESAIEGFEKSLSGAMAAASQSPSSSSGGGGGSSSGGGGGGSW